MRKKHSAGKRAGSGLSHAAVLLGAFFVAALCVSTFQAARLLAEAGREQAAFAELSAMVSSYAPDTAPPTLSPFSENAATLEGAETVNVPAPDPATPVPLPQYVALHERNPDFYGWLRIDGTLIDYPIMYTPSEPEYYLRRAFDGSSSQSGTPFIDGDCSAEGDYLLIYGHHMNSGAMFGTLPRYAEKEYYETHPVISFDTRFEQREYEIVAAFYSRLYREDDIGVFRYYAYKDLSDPKDFEAYFSGVADAALYNTGVTAEYGDQILVLSTCNYHTDNGRFVVVARRGAPSAPE